MNTAEIIEREVQSNSGFQMRQLFAESICEPSQSAKLHPHREILTLNVGRADMFWIGMTAAHFGYNLHDWPWGVPRIGVMLAPIAKQFRQLREVHIGSKCFRHAQSVVIEGVSRKLHAIREAVVQVPQNALVSGRARLPTRNVGINLLSAS